MAERWDAYKALEVRSATHTEALERALERLDESESYCAAPKQSALAVGKAIVLGSETIPALRAESAATVRHN